MGLIVIQINEGCTLNLTDHKGITRDELNSHFAVALYSHEPCIVCGIDTSYFIVNKCISRENMASHIRDVTRFLNSRQIELGDFVDLIDLTSEYELPRESIGRFIYSVTVGDKHELYCFRKFMKQILKKDRSIINMARKMNKTKFLKKLGNTGYYSKIYSLANITDPYNIKPGMESFLQLNHSIPSITSLTDFF